MSCKPRTFNKFISLLGITLGGTASFGSLCIYRGDENLYSKFLMPIVAKTIDPELAHNACLLLTRYKLIRCQDQLSPESAAKLKTEVLGIHFSNPIGLAAGFDKNAEAAPGLPHYGLGFAEVGTVTPRPQDGNPKKRIFRIPSDSALVNRCGFNNNGIDQVVENISRCECLDPMKLGLNLGKNKDTEDTSSDYLKSLDKAKDLKSVDYIVINISSPNTPGLRNSQEKKKLDTLLGDVLNKMNQLSIDKPLLVKLAPDLSDDQIKDVATVVTNKVCGKRKVDGVILTNTTISRPEEFTHEHYKEVGGLSGKPLRDMSTETISKFYKLTRGQVPIIGVGGVSSGQDAYDKIRAGASLVQLYTGLTYHGPPIVNRIKRELVSLLEKDNISSISEAVGIDAK